MINCDNIFSIESYDQSQEDLILALCAGLPILELLAAIIGCAIYNKHQEKNIKKFMQENKQLLNNIKEKLKNYKTDLLTDIKNLSLQLDKLDFTTDIVDCRDKFFNEYRIHDLKNLYDYIKNKKNDDFYNSIVKSLVHYLKYNKEENINEIIIFSIKNDECYIKPKTEWSDDDFDDDDDDNYITFKNDIDKKYTSKLLKNNNFKYLKDIKISFPEADYSSTYTKKSDFLLDLEFNAILKLNDYK